MGQWLEYTIREGFGKNWWPDGAFYEGKIRKKKIDLILIIKVFGKIIKQMARVV